MKKVDIINIETLNVNSKTESKKQIKTKSSLNCFDFILIFITILSFISLSIISIFSILWLNEYHFLYTIYRYINSVIYFYFPIQISSLILYAIAIFNSFTIIITSVYYIEKIVMERKKIIFCNIPRYHCIPLITNFVLYLSGSNIDIRRTEFTYLYYLNLFLVIISLCYLFKYYYVSYFNGINNEFNLNLISNSRCYGSDTREVTPKEEIHFFNIIIFGYLYGVLLSMNLYYFFYIICQFICFYIVDQQISIFIGDVVAFFLGLVAIYTAFQFKSIIMAFYFSIIYNGILAFYYSIIETERKKMGLGVVQVIINIVFIVLFSAEMIYLFILKKQKMNNYQTLNSIQN